MTHNLLRYGYKHSDIKPELDYATFKEMRDSYITKLTKIYNENLLKANVDIFSGFASFPNCISSTGVVNVNITSNGQVQQISAHKLIVASGSAPFVPQIPGALEYGITSDGFFELSEIPKKAVIIGAGYIAVELACMLNLLGTLEVNVIVRGNALLRNFDESIQSQLLNHMQNAGIKVLLMHEIKKLELNKDNNSKINITLFNSINQEYSNIINADVVLFATGRHPQSLGLNLPNTVKTNNGYIVVNEYQKTTDDRIFAIGDVVGRVELTPVAIAAGRRLADRLYGGLKYAESKLDYELVPTVVFSHPPIATVGITEQQAISKYGDKIKVYTSQFTNMFYALNASKNSIPISKPSTFYKIVTNGVEERIVGIHLIGLNSDEIIQGFAVAVKMGALKSDFDNTVAVHPTAAEELVTMR